LYDSLCKIFLPQEKIKITSKKKAIWAFGGVKKRVKMDSDSWITEAEDARKRLAGL
jgi:hypothetical protein